jgi:hypothetical protein
LLQAAARLRQAAGQGELDLGLQRTEATARSEDGGPPPITSTRMSNLLDSLGRAYRVLRFEDASAGDEVFASWCWPGSPSQSASLTAFAYWRGSASA